MAMAPPPGEPTDAAGSVPAPAPIPDAPTRTTKRTVMLIVGSVVIATLVAALVIVIVHTQSVNRQRDALGTANATLVTNFDHYSTRALACEKVANPYRCLERADLALLPHLRTYASALHSAGDLGFDAVVMAHARAQANAIVESFARVSGAAPTKAAYRTAVTRAGLDRVVVSFGDSLNAVRAQLDPSAASG